LYLSRPLFFSFFLILGINAVSSSPGRPDWANFRLPGDRLLWTVLEIYRSSPNFGGTVISAEKSYT
jgi:hypothetical protein